MGAWGAKLYQNDTALDIKDQFDDLKRGKTVRQITDELTQEYSSALDDIDCGPAFWFALADIQWNLGRLLPDVKEQALAWLDKGGDLALWREENPKLAGTREKVLKELQQKLNSPQPPEKKISQCRLYKCKWKYGDVYAYRLESDLAKEKELYGRYFLIRKIDESIWYPGHVIPIVYVKITDDLNLPSNVEEYDRSKYVQTGFSKYEERFLLIDARRPKEDIAEKSKITYQVDEYGFLPQYRARLLNTSKKVIPERLIYVGNFSDAVPPSREFVPHSKINIMSVAWKHFDKTFETEMIKRYCGHNLRGFEIYKNIGN